MQLILIDRFKCVHVIRTLLPLVRYVFITFTLHVYDLTSITRGGGDRVTARQEGCRARLLGGVRALDRRRRGLWGPQQETLKTKHHLLLTLTRCVCT